MKRSEINAIIEKTKQLLDKYCILLPPFGYWSPADWKDKGSECREIKDCMLGWDITDFGSGDYGKLGLMLLWWQVAWKAIAIFKGGISKRGHVSNESKSC